MSMKKKSDRDREQQELWIPVTKIAQSPGHPFYSALNKILKQHGFDEHVEALCSKFYKDGGRPSIAPGVYFRMLFIGYFENIESDRGIAWRCADSLALRSFLGYEFHEQTPAHNTLSVTRQRIDIETHEAVFAFCLKVLADAGLVKGTDIGIDATNLEANAAMRNIVRRDTGENYKKFIYNLAKEAGENVKGLQDLARFDRKREKSLPNSEWASQSDPDARISRMKKGYTRLTHKVEHSCDLGTGAVVGLHVAHADQGDTTTIKRSIVKTAELLSQLNERAAGQGKRIDVMESVAADKGYHSRAIISKLTRSGVRSYIAEPRRGRLRWRGNMFEQQYYYGNRRRIKTKKGVKLRKRRGEIVERSFAHCYGNGNLRRLHLRGRENIEKRLLIHVSGFNLSLLMRQKTGFGKPKGGTMRIDRSKSVAKSQNQATLRLNMGRIGSFCLWRR